MAHAENRRDVGHRQPLFICGSDGLVPLSPQLLALALQLAVAPRVVLSERFESGASLRCLTLRTRDLGIVRCILASRLAYTADRDRRGSTFRAPAGLATASSRLYDRRLSGGDQGNWAATSLNRRSAAPPTRHSSAAPKRRSRARSTRPHQGLGREGCASIVRVGPATYPSLVLLRKPLVREAPFAIRGRAEPRATCAAPPSARHAGGSPPNASCLSVTPCSIR